MGFVFSFFFFFFFFLVYFYFFFFLFFYFMLLGFGMCLEGLAVFRFLVPLLKPVLAHFGIVPVNFGIIMILNFSLGTLSPPVGTVMLLVCNTVQV
ncbi:TRAP transporter large permease subunit, partial [Escherichia coli]|uniref:TRAP transporter large permease subunit n=1 Tax=Escherichia coli TaxID=562 RepID=UPI0035D503D9